jgi:hypothetical protein
MAVLEDGATPGARAVARAAAGAASVLASHHPEVISDTEQAEAVEEDVPAPARRAPRTRKPAAEKASGEARAPGSPEGELQA